ncbi:MAG: glucose-6-phosphate isomerase family protein [Candidatus Micrarchaeota archaeon]
MDVVLYEKPLKIELAGTNLFVNGGRHPRSVRTLAQMRKVMMDFNEDASALELYYMYRSVYVHEGIRYDITLIPPMVVGGERAKTHGHYHPGSEDGLAYPEVYQVLRGHAKFIMQKKNRNGSVDAMVVDARDGDAVLLPPGWGHVTVNKGEDLLVLGNLVYDHFGSVYSEYEELQGAAFYYAKDGELIQNTNYIVQKNEQISAKELNRRYGFECKDLLSEFTADPKRFEFLKKPGLLSKK